MRFANSKTLLARFAIDKGKVTRDAVRPKAFEPNSEYKVSVFFIAGLTPSEICEIGRGVGEEIAQERSSTVRLFGWARFCCAIVIDTGLTIMPDDSCEYGDHANILGWPTDSELRMRLQVELASKSCPVRIKTVSCNPAQPAQLAADVQQQEEETASGHA